MTGKAYGEGLDRHLSDRHRRVQTGACRAHPSRRVGIPKPDGGERPLGIATREDKVVQKAVVDEILTPIDEAESLGFRDGFRSGGGGAPGARRAGSGDREAEGPLDSRRGWQQGLRPNGPRPAGRDAGKADRGQAAAGADRERAERWRAGGWRRERQRAGHPARGRGLAGAGEGDAARRAGGVGPRREAEGRARGEGILVRYDEDFVLGCQHRGAAERFRRDRTARLAGCGLERHPEKTRRIELGRLAAANRRKRGAGRPEAFDFLGCTHSCGQTGKGKFQLGRKPIARRMSRKRKALQRVLRARMHDDRKEVGRWLGQVRNG